MQTELLYVTDIPVHEGAGRPDALHAEWFAGRAEAQLGKAVGVAQFGVNLVTLAPGARSALRHWHEEEDEFVYVVSGVVTLIDENGQHPMAAGAVAGFPAGRPNAHQLANLSHAPASFLAVGSRHRGRETVHYPDDPQLGAISIVRDARGERVPQSQ